MRTIGLLLVFGFITLYCTSNTQSNSNVCIELYNHYQEYLMNAHPDTAEFFLNKAFKCDTSNLQYGIELYSLKLQLGKKPEALDVLQKLRRISSAIELSVAEELLIYDVTGLLDTSRIEVCQKEYSSKLFEDPLPESDLFYFVALTYFLFGEKEALSQLDNYESRVDRNSGLLLGLRNLMAENEGEMDVIRKAFNVK